MTPFRWNREQESAPSFSPLEIIAALAQGVVAVDPDRKVLLCNDSMAPLLNRPPKEAVGCSLWEILRRREITEAVDRVLAGGPEEVQDFALPPPAATVWRFRARPLPAGAVLTFTDLTNIRRLENVRRDFVANVSHELKTPLTSLRASLETLLDGALGDPAHARDFLATALHQVERLQRLIEDLLTLARLEKDDAPPRCQCLLAPAVKRTVDAMRPLAKKSGVEIDVALPDEQVAVALSEDELAQILTNLLDNAIKFNRPGGSVRLTGEAREKVFALSVRDTGAGIPPEHQPRVFERFYRVDKARSRDAGGTGLGLSIVKHITEKRGGSIRLEESSDHGSTFTVDLPRA